MISFSFSRFACLLLAGALMLPAAAGAASEHDFLAARDAFRAGDARKVEFYARRLGNYILEPYAAYWQLRLRLQEADAGEVRRFLTTYADTPLAGALLVEWLKHLGRTGQWEQFDADAARYTGEDLDVACYSIQSKVRAGQTDVLAQATVSRRPAALSPYSYLPAFVALPLASASVSA